MAPRSLCRPCCRHLRLFQNTLLSGQYFIDHSFVYSNSFLISSTITNQALGPRKSDGVSRSLCLFPFMPIKCSVIAGELGWGLVRLLLGHYTWMCSCLVMCRSAPARARMDYFIYHHGIEIHQRTRTQDGMGTPRCHEPSG